MATDPRNVLTMWTITFNATDYPDRYVVHGHDVFPGHTRPHGQPLAVVDTLEAARAAVPMGLYNLGRNPEDESQIVETWV